MRWLLGLLLLAASCLAQTDGPATLPKSIPTTVTLSPNAISVPAGSSLQTVVNAAQCGDFLSFTAATWPGLTLPMLNCDSQHWITIDLGGGKIVLSMSNASVRGGVFVRLQNGEITRMAGIGVVYNLIAPGAGAHDIVYNNLYVHGTPTDETVRGLETSNAYNGVVMNSRFEDFHCLSVAGSCTDSQAINGGLSSQVADSNWLIQNNSLSAAGENILVGGGAAAFVPCDWTVTGNTLYKPDAWNQNDPNFKPVLDRNGVPRPWVVKNLFELKNGCRFLVEHNTMRGSWGGFTQLGFAILLTPKNPNTCPVCAVEDITIRFNKVLKTGAAMQLACGPSDLGGWPAGCGHWSIHDNVFDDQQFSTCGPACGQWLMQVSSGYNPLNTPIALHDLAIINNSIFNSNWVKHPGTGGHGFLLMGGPPANTVGIPQMTNIILSGNVVPAGSDPIYSVGGAGNCAISGSLDYAKMIASCWTGNSALTRNVILTPGLKSSPNWPAGNMPLNLGANIN